MNDEQNTPEKGSKEDRDTSRVFLTTDSSLESKDEKDSDNASNNYYSVDDPKKEVSSTIGDGEMHNEGLVGDGSLSNEDPFSKGLVTDEQDEAEQSDNQG